MASSIVLLVSTKFWSLACSTCVSYFLWNVYDDHALAASNPSVAESGASDCINSQDSGTIAK